MEDGEGTNKQFSGKIKDETNLNYFEARYLDTSVGRFNQIDPAVIDVGDNNFERKYNRPLQLHLSNTQSLNSYSYVNNNPLRYTDPDGKIIPVLVAAWAVVELALSAYDTYDAITTVFSNTSAGEKGISIGGLALGLIAPGGGYGKGGKAIIGNYDNILRHVIHGDRKGGLHVLQNAIKQGREVKDLKEIGKAGVMVGKLDNNFKTFFPKNWTEKEIGESLKHLEKNHQVIQRNGRTYVQATDTYKGVRIEGTINQKGEITSFFPSANQ